ncbi:hypothetical protein GR702_02985 [Novosphingobium sp. FGD1]|jgi:hypothetical protein|uniref:Uncharacterized protein n=1 Tax=Novosphingobium silvae TaxID=2692619 RepID=A0A7X4GDQ0_9SPHN|nr:hypothetical protein [Novosphingobium silvae]MYL96738.1 hypothetical protein [Novosphingobium silvae]
MENTWVNTNQVAQDIASDLQVRIADLEKIGALIAAAHVQAAIDALRQQFDLPCEASETD